MNKENVRYGWKQSKQNKDTTRISSNTRIRNQEREYFRSNTASNMKRNYRSNRNNRNDRNYIQQSKRSLRMWQPRQMVRKQNLNATHRNRFENKVICVTGVGKGIGHDLF